MKPTTYKYLIGFIAQCLSITLVAPVNAQVILFDFDNAPLHSSLPITQTVSGVTAHFAATGQGFSVQAANALGFTPQGFSGYVIYPNSIYMADLLIKFESTLTDFSIMYACQELGCDDAATMRVTAYKNGTSIGTNTRTAINPGTWPVDTLRCSFPQGFDSVVLHYDAKPPTCQDYGTIFIADNMLVTTSTPLPVDLIYFDCVARKNTAILEWKSADEINLSGYIVQYAREGGDFHDLATINAEGSYRNYSFTHLDVNGIAYYRLKMLDQDGAYKYSEIKKLIFKTKTGLTIAPNPSSDFIHAYFDIALGLKTIQIFSIDGVILKTVRNYSMGEKINVSDLPTGVFILKVLSSKNETLNEEIFLKK